MRSFLILGLAVVGLQFGCGVEETDSATQPELASREDRLICLSESITTYYSDATYTTEVGTDACYCGATPVRTGSRSPYFIEQTLAECP